MLAKLPPTLGGAPSRPLDVGRATRVVTPTQRQALAVRDGGCVVPGCSRPLAWCEGHHIWHWLDGGPTDLDNPALLCRAHHRAIHQGGWRLIRRPNRQFTATHHTEEPGPPDGGDLWTAVVHSRVASTPTRQTARSRTRRPPIEEPDPPDHRAG